MKKRVEFYRHHLGEAERQALNETLGSLFLTSGPRVKAFEKAFAEFLAVDHVVTCSSCTTAMELVLAAMDIGPGDEVITTPATFIATPLAVIRRGAKPVFADVDPETGNLDPQRVEEAITERTRAILAVHLYGQMVDMVALRRLADQAGIALIEDAAHCVEGRFNQYGPGQLGDAACFSFYATKNITCGEGGAIAVRDDALAKRLTVLRGLGLNKSAADRYGDGPYQHWDMEELGYKANLSDIQASLLLPQLAGVEERLQRREVIAARYDAAFGELAGIGGPRVAKEARSARHLHTLWVGGGLRDRFLADMAEAGIGVAVNYRAVTILSYFRREFGFEQGSYPHAERIGDETASIPMYPGLEDDEVERVIAEVRRWAERHGEALADHG